MKVMDNMFFVPQEVPVVVICVRMRSIIEKKNTKNDEEDYYCLERDIY